MKPFVTLALLAGLVCAAYGETGNVGIKIIFEGGETVIRLGDGPAAERLLSRLPLTLKFEDFAGTEKIARLQERLNVAVMPEGGSGDFAYYAPWGNLAVFYAGSGKGGGGLYILGNIESGKEEIAAMKKDFTAVIERIP